MDSSEIKHALKKVAAEMLLQSRGLSWIQQKTAPSWRVLTYHRVVVPGEIAYPLQPGMYVTPTTLRMHIEFLKNRARVVSLESLLSDLRNKVRIPSRTVVVTFDDGWLDNYQNAFPLLRELQLPATICLATSYIGTPKTFWTDQVIQSITALSRSLEFSAAVAQRVDELKDCPEEDRNLLREILRGESDATPLADRLIENLKRLPRNQRQSLVDQICAVEKDFAPAANQRHFMNWDEVREMSQAGISFISHSHQHRNMAELSEEELRDEVIRSLQTFREQGVTCGKGFCYPGGYNNALSQQILDQEGIEFVLGTTRESFLSARPKILGRVSIHEDVSRTPSLFAARCWVKGF